MTAQHNSVLEENQRLRAKLENLEQVLKVLPGSNIPWIIFNFTPFTVLLENIQIFFLYEQHMREVAERRQQLELEHEQALAILKFKQDEIKRLQRVRTTVLLYTLHILQLKSNPYSPHVAFSLIMRNGGVCPAGGNLWASIKHHIFLSGQF